MFAAADENLESEEISQLFDEDTGLAENGRMIRFQFAESRQNEAAHELEGSMRVEHNFHLLKKRHHSLIDAELLQVGCLYKSLKDPKFSSGHPTDSSLKKTTNAMKLPLLIPCLLNAALLYPPPYPVYSTVNLWSNNLLKNHFPSSFMQLNTYPCLNKKKPS